jgi:hypothetical protein
LTDLHFAIWCALIRCQPPSIAEVDLHLCSKALAETLLNRTRRSIISECGVVAWMDCRSEICLFRPGYNKSVGRNQRHRVMYVCISRQIDYAMPEKDRSVLKELTENWCRING